MNTVSPIPSGATPTNVVDIGSGDQSSPGFDPASARLVPLTTPEQFLELQKCAAGDHHMVVCPSHLVMKGNQIVGYGSIGAVPMLNCWVHSKHVNKFESLRLLREAEGMLAVGGAQFVILPVDNASPFRRFVTKLGYTVLGSASYNIKRLKPVKEDQ